MLHISISHKLNKKRLPDRTNGAREGLLPSVYSLVPLFMFLPLEFLATMRAVVFPDVKVMIFYMTAQ